MNLTDNERIQILEKKVDLLIAFNQQIIKITLAYSNANFPLEQQTEFNRLAEQLLDAFAKLRNEK